MTKAMTSTEFESWICEEFELLPGDVAGDPTLIGDLGFDSWGLYVLYSWIVHFTGSEDLEFPEDLNFSEVRVSDVFTLYSSLAPVT